MENSKFSRVGFILSIALFSTESKKDLEIITMHAQSIVYPLSISMCFHPQSLMLLAVVVGVPKSYTEAMSHNCV